MSTDENARVVFEQYWINARSSGDNMIKFTSIFGAVMLGSLAVLGSQFAEAPTKVFLSSAMIIFSIFGFLYMHVCRIPWLVYSRLAEAIMIHKFKQLKKYKRFETYRKTVSAGSLFHCFYIINIALFFALLAYYSSSGFSITNFYCYPCLAIVVFLIVILIMSALYLTMFKSLERQIHKKIDEITEQDQDG